VRGSGTFGIECDPIQIDDGKGRSGTPYVMLKLGKDMASTSAS
jgi:hypothetical protein